MRPGGPANAHPAFADLAGDPGAGAAHSRGALSGGGERGVVEWVHPGGARLIVHRGAAGSGELRALVKRFLRHSR